MNDEKPKAWIGDLVTDGGDRETAVLHVASDDSRNGDFREMVSEESHHHWRDETGRLHLRAKETVSTSVGYSRRYSSHYDDIDWGN